MEAGAMKAMLWLLMLTGIAAAETPPNSRVRGSLDKEIIRRVIAKHINEIKRCYEEVLKANANLSGRAVVQFTIAGTGAVVASAIQESTMDNAQVERCMADAVLSWEFPDPQGGGQVVVSYPFILKPATNDATTRDVPGRVGGYQTDVLSCLGARETEFTLEVTIGAAGKVEKLRTIPAQPESETLEICLKERAKKWVYSGAKKGDVFTSSFDTRAKKHRPQRRLLEFRQ